MIHPSSQPGGGMRGRENPGTAPRDTEPDHTSRFEIQQPRAPLGFPYASGTDLCAVPCCDRPGNHVGYCAPHRGQWKRAHGPVSNRPVRGYTQDDNITYRGAHTRVTLRRGRATEHGCVDCDEPAEEWSYDGGDPAELMSPEGAPYSEDVERYSSRCVCCHLAFDGKKQRRAA